MSEQDYYKIFEELAIEIKPLPENYNPDSYGRALVRNNKGTIDISYSSSTNHNQKK